MGASIVNSSFLRLQLQNGERLTRGHTRRGNEPSLLSGGSTGGRRPSVTQTFIDGLYSVPEYKHAHVQSQLPAHTHSNTHTILVKWKDNDKHIFSLLTPI